MRLELFLLLSLLALPCTLSAHRRDGESSPRHPTYHIDTRNQYHVIEILEAEIKSDNRTPFSGKPVTVKFDCPLGYVNANSEENRSYQDQIVHKIAIQLNGITVPFKEHPTKRDTLFWCLDREVLRGGDQVAVRFTPPLGMRRGMTLRVELDLTRVLRKPVERADPTAYEPPIALSETLKTAYQKIDLKGNRVDTSRLKEFLAVNNLWWTPEEPTRAGIERFAYFFATHAKYDSYANSTDINQIFENINTTGGSCNPLAEAYVFGRRIEGGIARKIGGRIAGKEEGHAISQEYDPTLETFVTIDPASLAAVNTNKSKSSFEQIGRVMEPRFIAFQGDLRNAVCDGISTISEEVSTRTQSYLNRCGSWFVSCDGSWIADIWPRSMPGGVVERIKTNSRYYVRYDKTTMERIAMQ
ncbi:MAG: hypothetical protein NT023_19500 [Armatimonadetes bacterium]|nr:hypothetical protein [Armatimonadota bacterium]